ncbi:PREDICTED: cell wall integrity and stress response component 1-like isoform X1 [Acromyrmex echinatior]|uniref:cell wall integrity and stress response component 1-like isoform X1 n=1 Tax=Acromyrmex echinatior TaxID=103372 RepID=UPI000581016D|nr:PREDICTED: cell wall integrity and stress response component 1-like isoform X1 [Acromyrmex echinatior]
MRRASSGRESRHRLFTECTMMAECLWTGCTVLSGSSIEYTVKSISHRGGKIERNRGSSSSSSSSGSNSSSSSSNSSSSSSTCLGRDNKCQNGTTPARAEVDQTWGRETQLSNAGRCSRRIAGSRGCM